ncbi:MAG: cupin domain-containing protein [Beijerinckiaceae bacterium]|nr:cupin domain-containing protein [Beijerinckiaceae bacterium]MCI0734750.1 cupin domain-containing protein [Beijerinckiaceae bacterium]
MSDDLDQTAAAYALGLTRGSARAEIEARLGGDLALQAKVKHWQENFAVLDLAAGQEAPPAGLFDSILDAIDADEKEPPGTVTRRAGSGKWLEMAPGVTFTVLFDDPVSKRRSMLVRATPGAIYESHLHGEGHEECLVLEGDLMMGDLTLSAGDYHLAAKGSTHPPATTRSGALLYLSTPL